MAHTCPVCGQVCYCGGDIDDMELDNTPAQMACTHCDDCDDDDDFDSDDPGDTCLHCNGLGAVLGEVCTYCDGTGRD